MLNSSKCILPVIRNSLLAYLLRNSISNKQTRDVARLGWNTCIELGFHLRCGTHSPGNNVLTVVLTLFRKEHESRFKQGEVRQTT